MILISWNCRGLGSASAVRAVREVIRSSHPQILGLIETKRRARSWSQLRVQLGFLNCFAVDSEGASGGIAILWHHNVDLRIKNFSKNHIDMVVESDKSFRLTLFYGDPDSRKRKESWSLLQRLKEVDDKPWLVMGDFNEVFYPKEAIGVRPRDRTRMRQFRETSERCSLMDIGFSGSPFTFSNKRVHPFEAKARLDRALANSEWRDLYPESSVHHLTSFKSDHCPLQISLSRRSQQELTKHKGFKLEKMWLRHIDFNSEVTNAWHKSVSNSVNNHSLVTVLQACAKELQRWNSKTFGNVQHNLKRIKGQLEQLHSSTRTLEVVEKERELSKQLDEWLNREELLWCQRSRIDWLREGDRNTRFFHAKASQRKKTNAVESLMDHRGILITDDKGILEIAKNYFINIFQSNIDVANIDWDQCLHDVDKRVSQEMNISLNAPVTMEEVKMALFQMGPNKAPGIDGFPAFFFQKYWNIVGQEVCNEALNFLNDARLDSNLNATEIVLIPKCKKPERMEEFRPISLCNVGMKIITKVLANRLKLILPDIISPNQSAFVNGRLISDNILIAHEISHFIKTRRGSGKGYISLKLDMSKAFDRIEWSFLENMMIALGFEGDWMRKVLQCISSVKYRVKVNSSHTSFFTPSRGIRQGDPISPYLFIMAAEWISASLNSLVRQGRIQGIKIRREAPAITHLFFADDSLIFLRADTNEIQAVKDTLVLYELISGQMINFAKSELVCSPNVSQHTRDEACRILGVTCVDNHSKYLGLPMVVGQNKVQTFSALEDKVTKRLLDWKARMLSYAGKEVLIKSVCQSIPVYAMNCYKLPLTVSNRLQKNIIRFWWSSKTDGAATHWVSKSIMMKDKNKGGLGFRNLSVFNDALLLKQAWRILTRPETLLSQLYKARYFAQGNFMDAGNGTSPSHAWRGIAKVKHLLREGMAQNEMNGEYTWHLTSSGEFSAKSAYFLMHNKAQGGDRGEASNTSNIERFWKAVWNIKLPGKVKVMIWRLYHNGLPDTVNLWRRGCTTNVECVFCGYKPESPLHLFRDCWRIKAVGEKLDLPGTYFDNTSSTPADWLFMCFNSSSNDEFRKLLCAIWVTWGCRNSIRHGEPCLCIDKVCTKVLSTLFQCDTLLSHCFWKHGLSRGTLSIFCDGSWTRSGDMGYAAICLYEGVLQAVNLGHRSAIACSRDAEGFALLAGIRMAMALNLTKVTFFSDAVDIVLAVGIGYLNKGKDGGWLTSCMDGFRTHSGWHVEHIGRENNTLADKVAGFARLVKVQWSAVDSIPVFMSSFL